MSALLLQRESHTAVQTLGKLYVIADDMDIMQEFETLELPWLDNQKSISCIPKGNYIVRPRYSEKYKNHLIVLDAETKDHPYPRTFILIHAGNYVKHTKGCILIGLNRADINQDGTLDITRSRIAMDLLMNLVTEEMPLVIT